jgi:hypothetical protein
MLGRKSRRHNASPWIVAEIDDAARRAAEQAAAQAGTPLEIWLADTVLRACQEGVENPATSWEVSERSQNQ